MIYAPDHLPHGRGLCQTRGDWRGFSLPFQAQDVTDDILIIAALNYKIWHGAMRGLQCDRQGSTRHSGDVSDVIECWRRRIGRIALSIDSVALSAFCMCEPTAFSNAANLLRICICKECDHRYGNDRSAQQWLDRYDLSHDVAPGWIARYQWSGWPALYFLVKTF